MARTAKPTKAPPAPKLSKEELRVRVEKLERANVNLRSKNRALGQSLRHADERVIELEALVARFERAAAPKAVRRKKDPVAVEPPASVPEPDGAAEAPLDDHPPEA